MSTEDHDLGDVEAPRAAHEPDIARGTKVYVRNRFLGGWSEGFEVVEVLPDGYCVRRISDGSVVPEVFAFDEVRRERRRNPWRSITGSFLERRH